MENQIASHSGSYIPSGGIHHIQSASSVPDPYQQNISAATQKAAFSPIRPDIVSPVEAVKASMLSRHVISSSPSPSLSDHHQDPHDHYSSQHEANMFIKSGKGTSEQSPYMGTSIPSFSGHRQILPLAMHQLKLKQEALAGDANGHYRNGISAPSSMMHSNQVHSRPDPQVKNIGSDMHKMDSVGDSYSSNDQQVYLSSQASHTMVSSFPYCGSNESMYSQQSSVPSYIDGGHPSSSQSQMYHHSYQAMGMGVNPQAMGVAQQAHYLHPGQAASQRVPISHTSRASPITVQWLIENYETADGVSLPRSTLYHHYLRHCAENKIDAVNAASFGKLIRSVFLGLKTRRLGTRGNSKYHYYGIRVKPNSPLARLTDDMQVAIRAQPSVAKKSVSSSNNNTEEVRQGRIEPSVIPEENSNQTLHQHYIGDSSDGLPEGPAIDLVDQLPTGISKEDIMNFGNYYRIHCEALLEVISTLQFEHVESLWQAFYKSPAAVNKNDNGTLEANDYTISRNDLVLLVRYPPVESFIKETDYLLYQKLINVLVPDVLRAVPSSLTLTIRNFAKSLENMLIGSMSEMPKEIVNIKVAAVGAFSQTLRRYTSLNHLAQAARAVLQNPQQINQMWTDLNKVDFNNVQEQSSWVCQCDQGLISRLENDFKQTLAQQQSLEQWAQWLESVVAMVLEQHQGHSTYPKAARQFLLNWSFYSSMIIRDLTLRSAASFGSFHLIRLLYDEYMFYLIEHKVAEHTRKSPVSVIAECINLCNVPHTDYIDDAGMDEEEELEESSREESPLAQTQPTGENLVQSRVPHQTESTISTDTAPQGYDPEPMIKKMKQEYA